MAELERDEKAEQAPHEMENEQEAEKLLNLKRKEALAKILAPNNMLGLLNLYFLFVGAVVAFGVLAFYTGHKTTQEVVFFISALLFLVLPAAALWYLFPLFIKKTALSKLLDRINRSSGGTSLMRIVNSRIFRVATIAMYVFNIANAIFLFPKHPRVSLALLTMDVAFSFWLLITWALEALKRDVYQTFGLVVELNVELQRIANAAYRAAMGAHEYILNTQPSHDEAHKTTTDALRKMMNTLELVATTIQPDTSVKEIGGEKAAEEDPKP